MHASIIFLAILALGTRGSIASSSGELAPADDEISDLRITGECFGLMDEMRNSLGEFSPRDIPDGPVPSPVEDMLRAFMDDACTDKDITQFSDFVDLLSSSGKVLVAQVLDDILAKSVVGVDDVIPPPPPHMDDEEDEVFSRKSEFWRMRLNSFERRESDTSRRFEEFDKIYHSFAYGIRVPRTIGCSMRRTASEIDSVIEPFFKARLENFDEVRQDLESVFRTTPTEYLIALVPSKRQAIEAFFQRLASAERQHIESQLAELFADIQLVQEE
jgi:hypothetical protein